MTEEDSWVTFNPACTGLFDFPEEVFLSSNGVSSMARSPWSALHVPVNPSCIGFIFWSDKGFLSAIGGHRLCLQVAENSSCNNLLEVAANPSCNSLVELLKVFLKYKCGLSTLVALQVAVDSFCSSNRLADESPPEENPKSIRSFLLALSKGAEASGIFSNTAL